MEWTEDVIARLRALWQDGHSTAEIGRRLGVSKNAVVGKAHRLALTARPSPIRRDGVSAGPPRPRPPRRLEGSTLPPLTSVPGAVAPAAVAGPAASPRTVAPRTVAPRPDAAAPRLASRPVMVAAVPRPHARAVPCCWPIGEPGTRSFRFCDAEALQSKPYCAAHAEIAYVKVRERREDAA